MPEQKVFNIKPPTITRWERFCLWFVRGQVSIDPVADENGIRHAVFVKRWRGKIYVMREFTINPRL